MPSTTSSQRNWLAVQRSCASWDPPSGHSRLPRRRHVATLPLLESSCEAKQCVSGPAGVAIGLSNGDSTVTDAAGAFVFGPLIPGAYCANSVTASTWTLKDYQKNVRKNKFYVFRVS